jgi:uncharacterized protein (TIGR02594 family)
LHAANRPLPHCHHLLATRAVNSARDAALRHLNEKAEKREGTPVMVLRITGMLVCLMGLFAAPAVAKPVSKERDASTAARQISHRGDVTEWSARKRHRAARHHSRRHHVARHRVPRQHLSRQVQAAPMMHGVGDLHGVAGSSYAPVAAYAPARAVNSRVAKRAANSYASATVHPGAMRDVGGTGLVAEARRYLGTNPTGRSSLWCGHFMNLVLERSGHRASGSNTARSFASYGRRVSGPQVGAIAVMSRGRNGGHVGVVSGIDANGNPIIISGNHGRRVAESTYSRGRIFAYVMP